MTKAMHMFLAEHLLYANPEHISVIIDPFAPAIIITVEATEDDMKALNALLGLRVDAPNAASMSALEAYHHSPAYRALEQRGE